MILPMFLKNFFKRNKIWQMIRRLLLLIAMDRNRLQIFNKKFRLSKKILLLKIFVIVLIAFAIGELVQIHLVQTI